MTPWIYLLLLPLVVVFLRRLYRRIERFDREQEALDKAEHRDALEALVPPGAGYGGWYNEPATLAQRRERLKSYDLEQLLQRCNQLVEEAKAAEAAADGHKGDHKP